MAQSDHGETQSRFDGSERQTEQRRDIAVGAAFEERKLQNTCLLSRQLVECGTHSLHPLRRLERSVRAFRCLRLILDLACIECSEFVAA